MTENGTSKVILAASCCAGAGFAGLVVSDFLPPVVEGIVVVIALCLLGLGAVAIAASLVVIIRRAALRHAHRSGRLPVLIAIASLALFLAMAMAWGFQPSALCFVVVAQLIAPVLVTAYGAWPDSALKAAMRGGGVALVSFAVLGMLYVLVIGIETGYLFGDFGPGLRGLGNLGDLMALFVIAVWPIPVVVLAGALGGILGRKLCSRRARDRPS